MTVVVRRFAASPARNSSDVWGLVTKLICRSDKNAEIEFGKVAGVASCLINDEAFAKSPLTVVNDGPRLRVYCIYGEDAISADDANESGLSWEPIKREWLVFLPCLSDDYDIMLKAMKGKSSRFQLYDVAKGIPDEEKVEKSASAESSGVDWEAFNKL